MSDAIEALTEALNVSGRGNTLAKAKETMDQVRDTLTSIETIQKSLRRQDKPIHRNALLLLWVSISRRKG